MTDITLDLCSESVCKTLKPKCILAQVSSASSAHLKSNHTLWKAPPCSALSHLPAFLLSKSLLKSGLGRGQVACWVDHVDCRGHVYCCCCIHSLAGIICWTADLSGCNSSRTCQRGAPVYPANTNTVATDSKRGHRGQARGMQGGAYASAQGATQCHVLPGTTGMNQAVMWSTTHSCCLDATIQLQTADCIFKHCARAERALSMSTQGLLHLKGGEGFWQRRGGGRRGGTYSTSAQQLERAQLQFKTL